MQIEKRKTIVLFGIGHTNALILHRWVAAPINNCDLICISKFESSTYSAMLPGTLAGQFKPDQMRFNLPQLAKHANAKLILGDVIGCDLTARQIHFADQASQSFDLLSIGIGSVPSHQKIYANEPSVIAIKPMQTFFSRLKTQLDRLSHLQNLKVAIIGGGVATVELALCLEQHWRSQKLNSTLQLSIVTASEHIANGMKPRSISKLTKIVDRHNIAIKTNRRIVAVTNRTLLAESGDVITYDIAIWATGASAPPVLQNFDLLKDAEGFISTRQTLQSFDEDRIFAVGDAGTMRECPTAKAGVYAVRQAPILWHNLNAIVKNKPLIRYEPQSDYLKILNTGDGRAYLEYGAFGIHARWCLWLKHWIDQKFIRQFKH